MPGSWHVWQKLPDGRVAVADHREPICAAMRKVHRAILDNPSGPLPPRPLADIAAWLDANTAQSQKCQAGKCDHD